MAPSESKFSPDYQDRFSGIGRLYGKSGLEKLRASRAAVIGIGGVGTWTAEALVRSGIGALTLIDLDEVCITNVNRQAHALDGQIGRPKVEAMADRLRLISPECQIETLPEFFTASSADRLLKPDYDVIVDAIDNVKHKALLVALCRDQERPLIVSGGAGGKRDPSRIRTDDLAYATNDKLLKQLRKKLRRDYDFPEEITKAPFGFRAAFCDEKTVFPWADGTVCGSPEPGGDLRLNCESGFGTAAFITGAVGFAAAAEAVNVITGTASR